MYFSLSGFALLEAGCISMKSQTNAFYKSITDIVIGGSAYWLFGYGLAFGMWNASNCFIGIGDFALNPTDSDMSDSKLVNFVFQVVYNFTKNKKRIEH